MDRAKHFGRVCAHAEVVGLIGPAHDALAIDQHLGRIGNIAPLVRADVADTEGVEQYPVGVAEKDQLTIETSLETLGGRRRVDADCVDPDAGLGDSSVVGFELDELGAAERSPIAAIEYVEPGRSRLADRRRMYDLVLIGQRIRRKRIADGYRELVRRQHRHVENEIEEERQDDRLQADDDDPRQATPAHDSGDSQHHPERQSSDQQIRNLGVDHLPVADREPPAVAQNDVRREDRNRPEHQHE